MDDIKAAFLKYDADRSGFITSDEAFRVLQDELGFSEDQTRRMIRTYDRNADNKLNYEEFIWFYWKIQEKKAELQRLFQTFDRDNNKTISYGEATTILQDFGFSPIDVQRLFELHDTNGDGVLNYDEFVQFWSACGGRQMALGKQ